jgi:hypothetical protein
MRHVGYIALSALTFRRRNYGMGFDEIGFWGFTLKFPHICNADAGMVHSVQRLGYGLNYLGSISGMCRNFFSRPTDRGHFSRR